MAPYRDRLFPVESRDFEDLIYDIFRGEIERDYAQNRFDAGIRDALFEFLKHNVRNLAIDCGRLYRANDVYESEAVEFARKNIDPFEELCFRELERQADYARRRDYDRDRGYDRRDDRRRGLNYSSGGYTGGAPGTFGFGREGRHEERVARDMANREADKERQSRIAEEASKREREKDRLQGLNKQPPKVEVSRAPAMNMDRPGVTYKPEYAVVATTDKNVQIQIVTNPVDVVEGDNHCYHVDSRETVIVGNTWTIDTRRIFVRCPMRSLHGAFNLISYDNSHLTTATNWCHFVAYLKATITKAPGIGDKIVDVMAKISEQVKAKQLDPQTKLLNIQIILNDATPDVRLYFVAKILRKWNTLALTEFALPNMPNSFLSASDLQMLSSFYPNTMGEFDSTVADKVAILSSSGKGEYLERLNWAVGWVLKATLDDRCGFVDMRQANNLPLLTMFPDLPFVVGGNKRPADLGSMTDEEKSQLGQRFTKDWVMSIDRVTAVITNLNPVDILTDRRVTCCSATDLAVPAYFRTVLKGVANYAFYEPNRDGDLEYLGHFGMAANKDLMMVKYKED